MIALITPTGARPKQMRLCAKWMSKQTYAGEVLWVIVDDAEVLTAVDHVNSLFRENWNIVHVFPENPKWIPGLNTQARNLREGIAEVMKYESVTSIFIIEDDDYYCPTYLEEMLAAWRPEKDLVGQQGTIYYHVGNKQSYLFPVGGHVSLFRTAFRPSLIRTLLPLLAPGCKYIDKNFWKTVDPAKKQFMTFEEKQLSIGIKGMGGRNGIGVGHALRKGHSVKGLQIKPSLKTLIGEDAQYYETY